MLYIFLHISAVPIVNVFKVIRKMTGHNILTSVKNQDFNGRQLKQN